MDAKELKSLQKQARTAYKDKDYALSVKLCKTILKAEPQNYTALVCMGAALSAAGKGQQCVEAYKLAIAANATQIPAWQGLVKHYETNGIKSHPDLIEAYKRIAAFHEKDPDETKYIENTMKFAGVLVSQGEFQKGLKVLMRLAKRMKLPVNVATLVVQIVSNLKGVALTPEEELLHIDALDTLTKNSETAKDEYFKTFYYLLYKRNEIRRLIDECLAVPSLYNSIYYPLEYLCRLYVENHPEVDYAREVSALADKLFKLYPSSLYGYYAKGKYCYEFGRIRESIQWLKEGLDSRFNKDAAQVFIKAKLKFGDYRGALQSIEDLRRNVKQIDPELKLSLRILEIEALLGNDIAMAEKLLQEMEAEGIEEYSDTVIKLKAKLCVWKMDWSTLRDLIGGVKDTDPTLHFYGILTMSDEPADEILKFCESEHAEEEQLIMSGLTLWKLDKLSEAGIIFNKIAHSNKNHPLPFLYLGKLHSLVGDVDSAIKYFEISYELHPSNEAGSLLSDAYFEAGSGFEEKNKDLLTTATKRLKKVNSKWAWLRLGLLYLQIGDVHQATVALQSAVRTDYNDGDLWETLADAYFARGSYHSALKSYNKALELNVDPIYSTYKIGILYQQLNEFPQAIKTFEDLLTKDSTYVPAILELSKTHFKKAQNYFAEKRDSSGVQAIEECLKWATRCLELDNKVLPWKIIGDCVVLMSDLPASTTVKLPKFLLGPTCEDDIRPVDITQCLRIGTDCLHMALKECNSAGLSLAQSELYHDLANSYRLRAMRTVDSEEQKLLLQKALAAVKIAVSQKKTNHIYWNTLGVIASHKSLNLGPLAQHAFIKSLQVEPNNVVAWCNLGLLHYHSRNHINAHHCFSKAQTIDPTYSYCWVGQCIVAEEIRPMEAVDLYRHSCLLENYPDIATLGYTDWVCRLLATGSEKEEHYVYSVIKCEAVRTSFDLISHYCDRHPNDPYGFAFRGLLAGRLDLLHSAKHCFERTLQLLPQNATKLTDIIKCNLAATLLCLGETDKSFEFLQEIEDADFKVCCVAAKAFDTAKNYEMCIHAYEQAVEKAPDSSSRAEALIGLGIVHGKFTGLEEAKTHIFQAWRLARDKITGLLAIVALSLQKEELTNSDRVIANAVYEEIRSITEYDMLNDVATISSAWFLAEGNLNDARNCILRAARRYPWNPALWNTLAHFLIECHGKESIVRPLIRKSVARASVWERTSELLVALSYLLEADIPHGILYAKKAVHSEPYAPSTWVILILALYRQMGGTPCEHTLKYTLNIAKKALKLCTDQFSSIAAWLRDYIEFVPQLL